MQSNTWRWRQQQRVYRNGPVLVVMLITLTFFVILGGIGLAFLAVGQHQSSIPKAVPISKPGRLSSLSPQQLYAHITSSQPAFVDSLTHNDMLIWLAGQKNVIGCPTSSAQGLVLQVNKAANYQACFAGAANLIDFALQVKMTIVQGDEGGLAFRFNANSASWGDFTINQGGAFSMLITGNPFNTAIHRPDSAIKAGLGQSNVLTMIAQGQTFLFYANGHYLGQVTNTRVATSGNIGLLAYDANNPTKVAFSDLYVWEIS